MIQFDNVSKRYAEGHDALQNVSFAIDDSDMFFLTGHSGAGKSTLLKLIMMIEQPTRGQVIIGGKNLKNVSRSQIPYLRRQIGVVFQDHQLLFDRTVFDNVALPLQISGMPTKEQGKRVRAALDKVGLLHKEKMNPLALSGGEQQRIGIARAVVNKPAILLADEPTGNLDPQLSAEIMGLFQAFNDVGVSVLIATHDISLINTMNCPRLTLTKGRLITGGYTQHHDPYGARQ